jgi:hypothetical protein
LPFRKGREIWDAQGCLEPRQRAVPTVRDPMREGATWTTGRAWMTRHENTVADELKHPTSHGEMVE